MEEHLKFLAQCAQDLANTLPPSAKMTLVNQANASIIAIRSAHAELAAAVNKKADSPE